MKILIPSRGRPNRQITADRLHEAGIEFTIVRTLGDLTIYPSKYRQHVVRAKGLTDKRQAMLTEFPGKTLVLDDDITFFEVIDGKTYPITDVGLNRLVSLVDKYLDEFAHAGISQRFMIQNKRQPAEFNRRIMGCRGYNTALFPDPWPSFRLPTCQDIDFTMQLMAAGKPSVIITEYAQQDGPYMAPGGCAMYRTNDLILEGHRELQKLWPDYVKLREGPDKPGGVLATIYLAKLAKNHGLE